MKKKKLIIITGSIIAIIMIMITIYIKTDILKTKEQLFWKYLYTEVNNITKTINNNKMKKYDNEFQKSSYIKEGNILLDSKLDIIKPVEICITEKGNNKVDNTNTDVILKYDNDTIIKSSIIKDNNYYLIQNDNIDEEYICFENNNLKQLALNIGIENVEFIPNQIKNINYNELLTISLKEKIHIIRRYIPLYRKYIKEQNYSKIKFIEPKTNTEMIAYKLDVSKGELKELTLDILNNLKDDDVTLKLISDKCKIIDNSSRYSNIDSIKLEINKLIEFINRQEADDEKFISIIIYKKDNQVIKMEVSIKDNRTIGITLDKDNNKIMINQYNVKNSKMKFDTINEMIISIINNITEISYSRKVENDKSNNVELSIICSMGIDEFELKCNFSESNETDIGDIIKKENVEFKELNVENEELCKIISEKIMSIF